MPHRKMFEEMVSAAKRFKIIKSVKGNGYKEMFERTINKFWGLQVIKAYDDGSLVDILSQKIGPMKSLLIELLAIDKKRFGPNSIITQLETFIDYDFNWDLKDIARVTIGAKLKHLTIESSKNGKLDPKLTGWFIAYAINVVKSNGPGYGPLRYLTGRFVELRIGDDCNGEFISTDMFFDSHDDAVNFARSDLFNIAMGKGYPGRAECFEVRDIDMQMFKSLKDLL